MKFLIDNQLPRALAKHLEQKGLTSSHVDDLGLDQADDRDIWAHAGANDFVIVSKDADFLHLSVADPNGPAFVWVRLGNCRKAALLAAFDRVLSSLMQALNQGDKVIEVR